MRTLLATLAAGTLAVSAFATAQVSDTRTGESQLVKVRHVDTQGKPPFKRRTELLPVSDTAALEVEAEARAKPQRQSRPPYARNR